MYMKMVLSRKIGQAPGAPPSVGSSCRHQATYLVASDEESGVRQPSEGVEQSKGAYTGSGVEAFLETKENPFVLEERVLTDSGWTPCAPEAG